MLQPRHPVLERLVGRLSPDPRVGRFSDRGRHPSHNHGTFHRPRNPFPALTNSGLTLVKLISCRKGWTEEGGSATDLPSCDSRKPGGNGFEKAGSIAAESRHHHPLRQWWRCRVPGWNAPMSPEQDGKSIELLISLIYISNNDDRPLEQSNEPL